MRQAPAGHRSADRERKGTGYARLWSWVDPVVFCDDRVELGVLLPGANEIVKVVVHLAFGSTHAGLLQGRLEQEMVEADAEIIGPTAKDLIRFPRHITDRVLDAPYLTGLPTSSGVFRLGLGLPCFRFMPLSYASIAGSLLFRGAATSSSLPDCGRDEAEDALGCAAFGPYV